MYKDYDDDTSEEDTYSSGYDSDSDTDGESLALLREGVYLQPPRNEQPLYYREEPPLRRRKSKTKPPYREVKEGLLQEDIRPIVIGIKEISYKKLDIEQYSAYAFNQFTRRKGAQVYLIFVLD